MGTDDERPFFLQFKLNAGMNANLFLLFQSGSVFS
jgi:hypothetical protein